MVIQRDITLEEHQLLDTVVNIAYKPGAFPNIDLQARVNLLQFVLGAATLAYVDIGWPFNENYFYDEGCMELLQTHPEIDEQLVIAHKMGSYAVIRTLALLHKPAPLVSLDVASLPAMRTPPRAAPMSMTYTIRQMTAYFAAIRPRMKRYIEGDIELPIWNPQELYDFSTAATQARLGIPKLYNAPDLLLHRLGDWGRTKIPFNQRMRGLFVTGRNTLFCNTYGSGKTRMVLEGLCENWGLYFTTLPGDAHGSQDLPSVVQDARWREQEFKTNIPINVGADSEAFKKASAQYDAFTRRNLLQVLLARFLIMEQFLLVAYETTPMLTRRHRRLWVLLQVAPTHLMDTDIFRELAEDILGQTDDMVLETIQDVQRRVEDLIRKSNDVFGLFCAVDAAEHAALENTGEFTPWSFPGKSEKGPPPTVWTQKGARFPILRDIIQIWTAASRDTLTFVVSGSSVEIIVANEYPDDDPRHYQMYTNTGEFNRLEVQAHMHDYLPIDAWDLDVREQFLDRMLWLEGRYGFAADYITTLLKCGYCSPNRCLDAFLKKYLGAEDTDVPITEKLEPLVEIDENDLRLSFKTPDFSMCGDHWKAFGLLQRVAVDYRVKGVFPFIDVDAHHLLEAGFAHFKGQDMDIVIDEALPELAARMWFDEHPKLSRAIYQKL